MLMNIITKQPYQKFPVQNKRRSNCAYAFYSVTLTNASFPACTTIGEYAFRSCSFSVDIIPSVHKHWWLCVRKLLALTNASFPLCTDIGSAAFQSCVALTSVSFSVCTDIMVLRSKAVVFNKCIISSMYSIGYYAFQSCYALTSVSFPVCTSIGGNAFINVPL